MYRTPMDAPESRLPRAMPGPYYAFLFYMVIGVPLSIGVWGIIARRGPTLTALLRAPSSIEPSVSGELRAYTGRLFGSGDHHSHLGTPAAVWYGKVERTVSGGKSSTTSTWCTLGSWHGVYLEMNGVRVPVELAAHSTVDFGVGSWVINPFNELRPQAALQTQVELSPPPDSILAACGISHDVNAKGERWTYVEATASDGAEAGYFGCATEHGLVACKQGHLTLAGVETFKYAVARSYLLLVAGGILVCSFFAGVAGMMAYRAALALVTSRRVTP